MVFKSILLLAFAGCLLSSCQSGNSSSDTKKDVAKNSPTFQYNFRHPSKQWTLPSSLKEISGNAWIDADHLLVIEDLHPNLYLLKLGDSAIIEKTIPFGNDDENKFDIEDVTVVNDTAYALWSHGTIYKIAGWRSSALTSSIATSLSKENNTEGICFDPVSGNLLISCKNESEMTDEKKSTRSVFAFDPKTNTLKTEPFLLIHPSDLKKLAGEKVEFYPSAVAINPQDHDVFVLSTRGNKCIARYSYNGELKSLDFLDSDLLPQPEGLCFSPEGALYISSEGKHGQAPLIVKYDYQSK